MNSKLFRGSLDTIIIKLLSENGQMYGYEITQEVKKRTDGQFKITEGALYPALHRLEAKELLETETKHIGNRYRKYYKLTDKGDKEVSNLIAEMDAFLTQMRSLLHPELSLDAANINRTKH